MKVEQFKSVITAEFKKQFPNGGVWFSKGALGNDSLCLTVSMIEKNKDCPNGIMRNSPFYSQIWMHGGLNGEDMKEKVSTELSHGAGISCNPEEGSYMAMRTVKFGYRNVSNKTPEQVVNHFSNYFKKMRKVFDENKHDIYGASRIDKKYFI